MVRAIGIGMGVANAAAVRIIPPSAPTGLSITDDGQITFTPSAGATSYKLYRSDDSYAAAIRTFSASPTADLLPIFGTTCSYKISAVNAGGGSALSSAVTYYGTFQDSCWEADAVDLTAHTTDSGQPWADMVSGDFVFASNKIKKGATNNGQANYTFGSADMTVEARITNTGASEWVNLYFRRNPGVSTWYIVNKGSGNSLVVIDPDGSTAATYSTTTNGTFTYRVTCIANQISVYKDSILLGTITSTKNQTTGIGIGFTGAANTTFRMDRVKVTMPTVKDLYWTSSKTLGSTIESSSFAGAADTDLNGYALDNGGAFSVASNVLKLDGSGKLKPSTTDGGIATYTPSSATSWSLSIAMTNLTNGNWPGIIIDNTFILYHSGSAGTSGASHLHWLAGGQQIATLSHSLLTAGRGTYTISWQKDLLTIKIGSTILAQFRWKRAANTIGLYTRSAALNSGIRFDTFSLKNITFNDIAAGVGYPVIASTNAQLIGVGNRTACPDGIMGIMPNGGNFDFFAANGGVPCLTTGTLANPFTGNTSTNLSIASPIEAADYMAGGAIVNSNAVPGLPAGTWLMSYHAEFWPGGNASKFLSKLGLAKSTDNGATWTDLGIYCASKVPFTDADPPPWDAITGIDMGGGALVSDGTYLYSYYMDCVSTTGPYLPMCVCRIAVADLVTAVAGGGCGDWKKYYNGAWTEEAYTPGAVPITDGVGGDATELNADGTGWCDVIKHTTSSTYVGVFSQSGAALPQSLFWLRTSTDGLTWSERVPLTFRGGETLEIIYPSLAATDTDGGRDGSGTLTVYNVVSPLGGASRWTDGQLQTRPVVVRAA